MSLHSQHPETPLKCIAPKDPSKEEDAEDEEAVTEEDEFEEKEVEIAPVMPSEGAFKDLLELLQLLFEANLLSASELVTTAAGLMTLELSLILQRDPEHPIFFQFFFFLLLFLFSSCRYRYENKLLRGPQEDPLSIGFLLMLLQLLIASSIWREEFEQVVLSGSQYI